MAASLDAKVLEVRDGVLRVTTRLRRPFGSAVHGVPVSEAALEWIGSRLVLQVPEQGLNLGLGTAPEARRTADWLAAQGLRPPVGG